MLMSAAKRGLVTHLAPYSRISDTFRTLRNMVEHAAGHTGAKVITVTSAEPSEGKTVTAVNLAIACAQAGRQVLLMDGNLHRPALHDIFSLSNHAGLSNVWANAASLEEVVQDVGIAGLSVLPTGSYLREMADPLESQPVKSLLARAKETYDYVILDAPALLYAADASTLALKSDGILWVVHARKSHRAKMLQTKTLVERMGIRVMGCVLNDAKLGGHKKHAQYFAHRG